MGDDIFEKLNDKQREAVLETEGYVRVITFPEQRDDEELPLAAEL